MHWLNSLLKGVPVVVTRRYRLVAGTFTKRIFTTALLGGELRSSKEIEKIKRDKERWSTGLMEWC